MVDREGKRNEKGKKQNKELWTRKKVSKKESMSERKRKKE
jgi:hypothetical protein